MEKGNKMKFDISFMDKPIEIIDGNPDEQLEEFKKIWKSDWKLKKVTSFFFSPNFLITEYPIRHDVGLVLETYDKKQIHMAIGCGYVGTAPKAAVEVIAHCLKGYADKNNIRQIEELMLYHDAICFELNEKGEIKQRSIDTSFLFYPNIRNRKDLLTGQRLDEYKYKNKIQQGVNFEISYGQQVMWFYNPQRHCFAGFINLISYMENITMEYHFGKKPYLFWEYDVKEREKYDEVFCKQKKDIRGIDHVNLIIEGDFSGRRYTVCCLIDRKEEVAFTETVYMALTGERLFSENNLFREVINLFRHDFYDKLTIKKGACQDE